MEEWFISLGSLVQAERGLAYILVLAGGLLSAASPCVLGAIPLIIGYVGGYAGGDIRRAAIFSSIFVLGLATTFTLLGAAASTMGRLLMFLGNGIPFILSCLCLLMAGQLIGLYNIPIPRVRALVPSRGGLSGAFLLGLITGVFSSPCATPVLAVVLTYVWSKGNITYGSSLLFIYAIGHCALIFLAGLSVTWTERMLAGRGFQGASVFSRRISALTLLLAGVWFGWTFIARMQV